MKALILIIVIGLIILVAAIWADVALAQTPEPEIVPLQVAPGCYRQEFFSWTEDQTITTYSVLHVKWNGKPTTGCGAIVKTDMYKWREFYELGSKCFHDVCIYNSVLEKPNGRPEYWTTAIAQNGHKLLRFGVYNQVH